MTDDLDLNSLLGDLPPLGRLPASVIRRAARRRRAKVAAVSGAAALVLTGVVTGVATRLARPARTPVSQLTVGGSASPRSSEPTRKEPVSPPTSPGVASTSPEPSATKDPVLQLVLEADGLGYVAGPASIRHLAFASADPVTVERAVARALGGTATRTPLPDCGAGVQVAAFTGFALFYEGTRFVGWSQTQRLRRTPATSDGIAVGTTLAELRQGHPDVVVTTGTLGPEWSIPRGLAGGLDGTTAASTINRVGAGQNCLFR